MKIKRKGRARGRCRGQSMVEFALILPVLLLVVVGIMELGRFMFVYASVSAAAREAARYGAAVGDTPDGTPYFADCDGIRAAAQRVARLIALSQVDIQYDDGNPHNIVAASCPPFNGDIRTGVRIRVRVVGEYHPFFLFQTTVRLDAESARTILRGVEVEQ